MLERVVRAVRVGKGDVVELDQRCLPVRFGARAVRHGGLGRQQSADALGGGFSLRHHDDEFRERDRGEQILRHIVDERGDLALFEHALKNQPAAEP